MMIDPQHPVIRDLASRGFKVSVHAYLLEDRVSLAYIATDPESGLTLQGRSRTGGRAEALRELAQKAELVAEKP